MFGLRNKNTGKFAGFRSSSNGNGDFCSSTSFYLSFNGENVWVVSKRAVAEAAAKNNVEWYNADFETPMNDYVGQLVVVEFIVKD